MNITTEQAIQWLKGNGDSADLSVVEYNKLIQPLTDQAYVWTFARAEDTAQLSAGKYLYKVSYLPLSENYAIGNVTKQAPVVDVLESEEIVRRDVAFVSEWFDQSLIIQAPQVVANYLENLITCYYIDCSKYFYSSLKAHGDAHPELTFYIPELGNDDVITDDQAKEIQQLLAKRKVKIGKTINRQYLGIRMNEFYTIIDPYASVNLAVVLTRLNASTSAYEVSKALIEGNTIDFNRIVTDNLLNIAIPRGTSTDRDTDYDMTGVIGFIFHNQFMAMPTLSPQLVSRRNGDGNTEFICKYGYTRAYLRPNLFCMLVKDLRAFIETKGTDQYVKCNATFRDKTATYSSSDESIATVGTDGKITVVGTGTVEFTVNLGTESAKVSKTF